MTDPCPHIVTDGATSYCALAEDTVRRLTAERDEAREENLRLWSVLAEHWGQRQALAEARAEADRRPRGRPMSPQPGDRVRVECPRCDGSGRAVVREIGEAITCPMCRGVGAIHARYLPHPREDTP